MDDEEYIIKLITEKIDKDIDKYIKFILSLNIGEIFINSIDNDGGLMGFDLNLIDKFSKNIDIPIIVQGGEKLSFL